jgi:HK97 family phage portal protein
MFGFISKKEAAKITAKALQSFSFNNTLSLSGGLVTYGYNNTGDQLNAYASIDDLYSIIRKIAKTCKRIPLYVYEVKDEKQFGKDRLMQRKGIHDNKSIWDLKELQTKSLEIIGEQDPLQKLLDNPNDFQSKDEFYEAAYSFCLLSGNEYLYLNILDDAANKGKPYEMYHLPPNYIFPVITNTFPRRIESYEWIMNGIQVLKTKNILHRRYFNPNYDYNGNELIGLSPLQAARRTLTQINNERDYANRALMNSGAEGVIYNEDGEYNPETFGKIKEDVLNELGSNWQNNNSTYNSGSNLNAKKLAFLSGKWNYLKMAISPADMQLVEQGKTTFKKLCNVYGVSDIWFNNDTASTESNVNAMIKQAYTNTILPEVTGVRDMLQKGVAVLYKDKRRIIDYDITDITELQEDTNAIATRFAALPAFRVNDLYDAMGFGKLDDPNADVVLIKTGYQPLADVATPIDINVSDLNKAHANDYK